MTIVGFSLSKIALERKEEAVTKLEIKTSINIKEVTKDKIKLIQGKDVMKFNFEYHLEYSPKLATILFEGFLLYLVDPSKSEDIVKEFKKSGKLDKEMQVRIYNAIFQKCNIKALQLEEDINLPAHIRLPHLSLNDSEKK